MNDISLGTDLSGAGRSRQHNPPIPTLLQSISYSHTCDSCPCGSAQPCSPAEAEFLTTLLPGNPAFKNVEGKSMRLIPAFAPITGKMCPGHQGQHRAGAHSSGQRLQGLVEKDLCSWVPAAKAAPALVPSGVGALSMGCVPLSSLLCRSCPCLRAQAPRAWLPSQQLHSPHPRALTPAGACRTR